MYLGETILLLSAATLLRNGTSWPTITGYSINSTHSTKMMLASKVTREERNLFHNLPLLLAFWHYCISKKGCETKNLSWWSSHKYLLYVRETFFFSFYVSYWKSCDFYCILYKKKKKRKRKKVACYIRFNIYETNSAFSKQNSLEKKKLAVNVKLQSVEFKTMESNSEASPAVLNKIPSVLKIIAGIKKFLNHYRLFHWVNLASHDWERSYFNVHSDD